MAGTDGNDSTFDDEWLLLRDVRVLTGRYTKGAAAAKGLILDYARKGGFRSLRWHQVEGESDRPIEPRLWGVSKPEIGLHVVVDWDNSCIVYRRDKQRAPVLNNLLQGFLPPPDLQMPLVRLHRDEVFAMLRAAGFTPPTSAPATASPIPAPAVPTPDLEVLRKLERSLAATRMYKALCEVFPPDGKGACDVKWKEIEKERKLEPIFEQRMWKPPRRSTFFVVLKVLRPNNKRKRRPKSVRH